jgi:hypothetical protein
MSAHWGEAGVGLDRSELPGLTLSVISRPPIDACEGSFHLRLEPHAADVRLTGKYGTPPRSPGLMLANLITFVHFAISSAMNWPNAPEVSGFASTPERQQPRLEIRIGDAGHDCRGWLASSVVQSSGAQIPGAAATA